MSRPSRSSFAKREKEKARFEKRQSKLARRHQPKGATDATSEDDGLAPDAAPSAEADLEAGETK